MPHARISSSLLAALLATAVGSVAAAQATQAAPDLKRQQAQINRIVAEVSPKRIEAYVAKLVSFGTRHTMSETESETRGIGAARRWIKSELERCGAGTPLQ